MRDDRIQRFTLTEVFLHWLNAVLYLVLAATGTAMLVERIFEIQTTWHQTLVAVHRTVGVLLVFVLAQSLLLSLFSKMFRQFWSTLRECLSWSRSDILWLLKVPLNMFFKQVKLPPVGRFNPGQKLHILFVFAVLNGFAISGLAIILIPGALLPWIIHLLCFLPAAFFLLLHLFLSLINPETRKALPGMITGTISHDYAKEHHPLLLGNTSGTIHKPYVSWKAALIFIVLIAILFGIAVWQHGFARFGGNLSSLIAHRGANLIIPGDLCASHACEPEAERCTACHHAILPISSEACLACHEKIRQATAQRAGYHGNLSGPCRSCHAEHIGNDGDIRRLDIVAFNHNLARFQLDGKHRRLECDKCHLQGQSGGLHQRTRYIGLDFDACSDCHTDPHGDQRAADCEKCHSLFGWKEPYLLFVHDRDSNFRLEGKHSDTPCEKCHVSQSNDGQRRGFVLYDLGTECSQCHSDPHNGQFAKGCESCHCEQGWTGRWLVDAHGSNSTFPLRGEHGSVTCIECHSVPEGDKLANAQFAGLGESCEQCHTDPHAGQFNRNCQSCHSEQGWKGRWLVDAHNPSSTYPLRGKHAAVDCIKCHKASEPEAPLAKAAFIGLDKDGCVSCHEDPHRGQMRSLCNTCHSEQGWTGRFLLFAHDRDSEFKLDSIHFDLDCSSCHKTGEAIQYRPLSKTCEQCHDDIANLQSTVIAGAAEPHAGRISCVKCHSTNLKHQAPEVYAAACRDCHNRYYEGLFYDWMKSLNSRMNRAKDILKQTRDKDPSKAKMLEQKINKAMDAGFHNLGLAIKLWDEIEAGDF